MPPEDNELIAGTRQVVVPPTTPAGGPGVTGQPVEVIGYHPDKGRSVLVVNIGTTTVYFVRSQSGDSTTGTPIFAGGAAVLSGREPIYVTNGPGTVGAGLVAVAFCPPGMSYATPGTGVASSTVGQGAAGAQAWPTDPIDRAARALGVVAQGSAGAPTAPWPVYPAPAPGSINATGTAAAAAALSVALPAVVGKTNYLGGLTLTSGAPAAVASGALTITGVDHGPLQFIFVEAVTVGGLLNLQWPDPIPATAPNTAITVALAAIAGGAATALTLNGSVQ